MRLSHWGQTGALVLAATGCGGRSVLIDEAVEVDGSAGGGDGSLPDGSLPDGALSDGAPTDGRGPTPVPVCDGRLSQCLQPAVGIVQFGAAVIQCQGEEYVGPWTLVLERLVGTNWQMIQQQVVLEPGFGATFYDSSGPPTVLTYRVCAIDNGTTALCGAAFTAQGPPDCVCAATTCELNTACNADIDNGCGGIDPCGPCANGMTCNAYHSCCPGGYMSDGSGGCICAPPLPGQWDYCPPFRWNANTCSCIMLPDQ